MQDNWQSGITLYQQGGILQFPHHHFPRLNAHIVDIDLDNGGLGFNDFGVGINIKGQQTDFFRDF